VRPSDIRVDGAPERLGAETGALLAGAISAEGACVTDSDDAGEEALLVTVLGAAVMVAAGAGATTSASTVRGRFDAT
jgi:hypothetical protein